MTLFKGTDIGPLVVEPASCGWVVRINDEVLTRTEVEELIAVLKEALER